MDGFTKVKFEIEKILVTAKTRRLAASWTFEDEDETEYNDPREGLITRDSLAHSLLRYFSATSRSNSDPMTITHDALEVAETFYERTAHQAVVTRFDLILTGRGVNTERLMSQELTEMRGERYGIPRPYETTRMGSIMFDAFIYMVEAHFPHTLWVKRFDLPGFHALCSHHGIAGRVAVLHTDAPHILVAFQREEDAFAFKMASDEPALTDR